MSLFVIISMKQFAVCLALAVKFDENRCQILELVLKCAKNELSHNKKVN